MTDSRTVTPEEPGTPKAAPGPTGVQRWRSIYRLLTAGNRPTEGLPSTFFEEVRDAYGSIARVRMPLASDVYFVADPAAVEMVLEGNQHNFRKDRTQVSDLEKIFGSGLVTSDGERWRRHKQALSPLLAGDVVREFQGSISRNSAPTLDSWAAAPRVEITGASFDLILDNLGEILLGADFSSVRSEVKFALSTIQDEFPREASLIPTAPDWIPTDHNRRIKSARVRLTNAVETILNQYPMNVSPAPIAKILLDDETLSREEVVHEIWTLLIAGLVTATVLTWIVYELAENPDDQRWVRERLADADAPDVAARADTIEDPLNWTIREAVRLYPPLPPAIRTPIEPCTILGFRIPAGSRLYLNQVAIHRNEEYWERPTAFRPRRFDSNWRETIPKYAYYPFGGGARACIGKRFAYLTLRTLLSDILNEMEVTVDDVEDGGPANPVVPPRIYCSFATLATE